MATPVILPVQGNTVEACQIVEWLVEKDTQVKTGDLLCAIETDKAVFEIESPAEGTLLDIFFDAGETVPVLTVLAAIGEPGENVETLRPKKDDKKATKVPTETEAVKEEKETTPVTQITSEPAVASDAQGKIKVSPRARRLAAGKGVQLSQLKGSGPAGRIIEKDVKAFIEQHPGLTRGARSMNADGKAISGTGSGPGGRLTIDDLKNAPDISHLASGQTTEVPLKGIRKLIAERMKASLDSTAQLTLNTSADARAMLNLRKQIKQDVTLAQKYPITINDILLFVTAWVLGEHPNINAHLLTDKIVQYGSVHMGFAVDTPRGLMVPVVRDMQDMFITEISVQARSLSDACRKGNISPDLLQGGTFTITNLGAFGIESFTPVINLPQVAILGVSTIQPKLIQQDDAHSFVPHIGISLTIDHQAVDGAEGARFLKDLANSIAGLNSFLTIDDIKGKI